MTVHDWRSVPSETFARIYDAEAMRWSFALHWDTRSNWSQVESARLAGRLPGLVARESNSHICGWIFYLLHNGALQIGGLRASSPQVTAALIDGARASAEGRRASSVVLFAYSDAPGLVPHLLARDFAVERYLYLSAGLTSRSPHAASASPTYDHARHAAQVAALLASAYPPQDRARPFVRTNQPHEWASYVNQLVTETGCGAFLPDVSFLAPDNSSTRLDGATLATRLAAETVHLAQIVVAPDAQGRGLARRLIGVSLEAARAQGFTRATLLVGEGNAHARRLYERLGFTEAASFVSAVCDQPRRSTSVGLETGGAITLR